MGIAEQAAPEIDRLVIGVNRRVGPEHGERLSALALDIGLESIELLPVFGDFLLDGLLSRQVALLRMTYRPQDLVRARLEELEEKGFIRQVNSGFEATEVLRPLLKAMRSALGAVARDLWVDHEVEVSVITEAARVLRDAITPDQIVAATYKRVREPLDRYSLLEQRLVNLRYMRQHDHIQAWTDRGLTAPEILMMTAISRGADTAADEETQQKLNEAGYLTKSDPPKLSAKGKKVRQAIEDDTNVRSQRSFDALDAESADRFLEALRALPA